MFYHRLVILQNSLHVPRRPVVVQCIAYTTIWIWLMPIVIMHVSMWLYQLIYFSIFEIPKVFFKDYLVLDRWALSKLNILQRAACLYCSYANAVAAYTKDIANLTEAYSCAIKHSVSRKGQEHQRDFHPYEKYR
jgi:hypothetical protein